jgi:hypothetical protein
MVTITNPATTLTASTGATTLAVAAPVEAVIAELAAFRVAFMQRAADALRGGE